MLREAGRRQRERTQAKKEKKDEKKTSFVSDVLATEGDTNTRTHNEDTQRH